jgi:hypothetical protein
MIRLKGLNRSSPSMKYRKASPDWMPVRRVSYGDGTTGS